jgi:hypothetical protein
MSYSKETVFKAAAIYEFVVSVWLLAVGFFGFIL